MTIPAPEATPNWDKLMNDVIERIAALRACWIATENDTPETHQRIARDIYVPALRLLAEFCASVEISEDPDNDQDEEPNNVTN